MVNWSSYKPYLIVIATTLLLSLSYRNQAMKWGFYGHKRINRMAVFTLPPKMFGFYKEHIEYITESAPNPDKRRYAVEGEAQRHFIDLDRYYKQGEDFRLAVPKKWQDAIAKFTEDTLQANGIVPWHIDVMKKRLQKAFEVGDIDQILRYSAEIGHYIGDAHVPLHTTENYNGQLTNQHGIHGLWESRLVEINANDYNYFVGKAQYITETLDYAWRTVFDSHECLDSVLTIEKALTESYPSDKKYSFERKGNTTVKVYSHEFSQAYHQLLNGMVERRMRKAIISVGSIWYTAWVDAGQPDLDNLRGKPINKALQDELDELNHTHENQVSKGRVCH